MRSFFIAIKIIASDTKLKFDNHLKKCSNLKKKFIMILFPSYINAIGPFLKVAVFFKEDSGNCY